jgi:hypothetical protein
VAGKPGHASSQGAVFYAEDFTSDISVRTVSGHRHSTEYRFSYAEPGDAKHNRHNNEYTSGHNKHPARNDINADRNDFHHRLWFNGNVADYSARKHHHWQPRDDSGNTGSRGQRGIGNWRNARNHAEPNWNFHHSGPMHAFQQRQRWNINDSERHAFNGQHVRNREQFDYRIHHDDRFNFAERNFSDRC